MRNIFPYSIDENNIKSTGKFLLQKLKEEYHTNYDYFLIEFLEGNLSIKNTNKKELYKNSIKEIKSVFAIKKDYLKIESAFIPKEEIKFYSTENYKANEFQLMIIDTDLEKKFRDELLINSLLEILIKKVFIGNERYLLQI
ncbi:MULTISPECIES: hypothetical protein [Bacillota]|uniref:Orfx1 TULIPs domain-containing protein n=2 Tax=Bacillota TaxID=1239 RepID=A0A9X3XUL6_ENTFC|nr:MULTISPECIES: hypothetical protein [Bacillota]MDC4242495.1 hypothetical protein [Clostridium tertium]MDC4246163.1 hypothetical protein [Clostridium perfringens]MDC4249074.1 hypothetical protein [Enterococcus faecium]